jgi:outer membrane biosynthesis protein TonB
MSRRFTLMILALSCLVFTGLACSLAGPESAPAAVEPTSMPPAVAPATAQPAAVPPTKVQIEIPTTMPTVAGEVLPTDTLTPTPTPTSTPTGTPTLTTTPTNTLKPKPATATPTKKPVSAGPLTIDREVVTIKRNPGDQAVLTLKVIATGGGGGYIYYNDDQKQAGAIFDVPGSCGKPFVHTIKVTSADGQTATLPYFIAGQCPAPSPTPKP